MFQYEVWSPSAPHKMYTVDDVFMVIFALRKGKLNGKILLRVLPFLSGASTVQSGPQDQ